MLHKNSCDLILLIVSTLSKSKWKLLIIELNFNYINTDCRYYKFDKYTSDDIPTPF